MASFPTAALAFLRLLAPMLHGDAERLMAVTQVERKSQGFRTQARRIFRETNLAQCAPYDLGRQRRMWSKLPPQLKQSLAGLQPVEGIRHE